MFNKKQKNRKATRIDTLIGENTHIEVAGNIIAEEGKAAMVTLSEKGRIQGEIRVNFQLINGQVNGNIYASEHVELAAKARINGNVFYQLLEMAIGAEVNGQLVHINQDENVLNVSHEDNNADNLQLTDGNDAADKS